MGSILWFLLADLVFLISLVLLVIAAFRIKVFYGFAVLFLPFSSFIFALKYWKEVGGIFVVKTASYAAMLLILGSSPEMMSRFGHKIPGATLIAKVLGTPDAPPSRLASGHGAAPTPPHEARDLAAVEAGTVTSSLAPTADPFAPQRAAYLKHNADLAAEYQRLNTERSTLKPGTPAVAAFNATAAHYQSGLQALQKELAQLETPVNPASAAALVGTSSLPNAGGTEAEGNAALARLRACVAASDYAGFAVTLRKCLADDRRTKVFPQITAYSQQVMRDTPPAKLGAALQLQANTTRADYEATTRKIQAIVNQTPPTVVPPRGNKEIYHYAFHDGAIKPDFNVADVVTGREAWNGVYAYVDTRPGIFYRSADCEFNPQTKFFYTNRDVPKKKLTDAENQEIVRLYRILGKDETIMGELPKRLADLKTTSADLVALNTQLATFSKDYAARPR